MARVAITMERTGQERFRHAHRAANRAEGLAGPHRRVAEWGSFQVARGLRR
jgi:hypothetical protein